MAGILLVGSEAPLLEGLAQTLAAVGHHTHLAAVLPEAQQFAAAAPPLVLIVDRALAASAPGETLRIPVAPGGSLLLYHVISDDATTLPPVVQRAALADLLLPLERNRLVALVQRIANRARETGRGPVSTPPEYREPFSA